MLETHFRSLLTSVYPLFVNCCLRLSVMFYMFMLIFFIVQSVLVTHCNVY
ncbi:hypothetical protein Hanom_Chr05g00439441 [Helianthus anomalus]